MNPKVTLSPSAIEGIEAGRELTTMQFDVTADGKNLYFGAPPEWWNFFIGALKVCGNEELRYWADAMIDAHKIACGSEPSDT